MSAIALLVESAKWKLAMVQPSCVTQDIDEAAACLVQPHGTVEVLHPHQPREALPCLV